MPDLAATLRKLSSGDSIKLWLSPHPANRDITYDEPYVSTVLSNGKVKWNEEDSYYSDDDGRRVHTKSDTYEVRLEPHPKEALPGAYVVEITVHRDYNHECTVLKQYHEGLNRNEPVAKIDRFEVCD
jgi:hypothetical protein